MHAGRRHAARQGAPANGVKIVFTGQRRPQADALLFQHRPLRRRRQDERLPEVLRRASGTGDASSRARPTSCTPTTSRRCAISCSPTAASSSRTTPAFRCATSRPEWQFHPFGRYLGPISHLSAAAASRSSPRCSKAAVRPDRLRHRLPLAAARVEPAACDQGRCPGCVGRPGARRDAVRAGT